MNEILYDKNVKCPICNNSFSSKKVRVSACVVDRRDEDFCIHYKDFNPVYYEIFVCPHCGYAASENSFDNLSLVELNRIKEMLSGKIVGRSFCDERGINDAIDSFKLALFIADTRGAKKSMIAGICLKIAWLYRELKDEKEMVFLKYALDNYGIAYDKEEMPLGNLDEISVQYLLGELSRRIGKLNDAVFWFNKAVNNPLRVNNPRIEKMTREQWTAVKQMSKKD
ncbi:MAG: hypothetical protein K0R84_2037 [Clostridia bacterium]|jgi:uncharacterized protein (DUF2225 family)|nr:hypothetical protein [Clostridia bacterium]